MLPYVKFQIAYVLVSGVLAYALWRAAGRVPGLKSRPWRRFLFLEAVVAVLALLIAWLSSRAELEDLASGFRGVAFGFYAGLLWVPFFVMRAAIRGDGSGRRNLWLAGLALIVMDIAVYAAFIEPNRLVLRKESIVQTDWPAAAPPFKLVHISDLQTVGPCRRDAEAVRMINALEPDLIVMTGDYMAGPFFDEEPAIAEARMFLSQLKAKHGVVVVEGHSEVEKHRRRIFEGLELRYLRDESWTLTLDEGTPLERRVYVFGAIVHGPSLFELATPRPPKTMTIVASHVPDLTKRLDGLGVDLHLAGHTHGGQIVIPFYGPPVTLSSMPRHMARGLFSYGDHKINVTAGIGMEGNHAPRIRFNCPPEICLLTITGR